MKARPELGAEPTSQGTRFACYADATSCSVRLLDENGAELSRHELTPLGDGFFEAVVREAREGTLYDFCLDGRCLPDPYARYLPNGVHGPAMVLKKRRPASPTEKQLPLSEQVIYELHVGTFTREGTFAAAAERLPYLVELGVTTVELMPLAAFSGARGWGYDGVALFAPHAAYGAPDDLARFVARAHELGILVWLDVVYNHFGPSGNYLGAYSKQYFREDLHNAWGQAPNFELPAFRDLVLGNARYWLEEFGFDGLRLDATHALLDPSARHILLELAELAHSLRPRRVLVAEDERNEASLVTKFGLDGVWADDFHHQARVTLTHEREGYYAAFEPSVRDLSRTIQQGWLYTGQTNPVSKQPRGTPATDLLAEQFVYCIQNHDQVGNRAMGERLSTSIPPKAYRMVSLLLLFLPMTPMLFMGQEWGARTPFLYFTDHDPELGKLVSEGRRREFAGFSQFEDERAREKIPDPQAESTFASSRLDWSERENQESGRTLDLYRRALALRKTDPVLTHSGRKQLLARANGQVLVVERWFGPEARTLLVNFGDTERKLAELGVVGETRRLLESDLSPHSEVLPALSALLLAGVRET